MEHQKNERILEIFFRALKGEKFPEKTFRGISGFYKKYQP